jgi:putative hemolysin
MKFITINYFLIFCFSFSAFAAKNNIPTKKTTVPNEASTQNSTSALDPVRPPKLAEGEFAIILDESYKTFKTKTYEKLELTTECFKNSKPSCIAYKVGLEKPQKVKITNPDANNVAVINCTNLGGKSFVALDHKNNEYNFCRFSDGSMVTAWSMYFKHNPPQTIK